MGITLGIARGAAAVINFDSGLILFSVCRNLISLLRSTFLNDIVPFDKNIMFHKTVAWSIVFFSIVHSVGHYVNYYRLEILQQQPQQPSAQTSVDGQNQSSLDDVVVLVTAFRDASETMPRTAQAMAILTGPGFTGHMLVLILFLMVTSSVERIVREIRARLPTAISKIVLHPSKVVEVQIIKSNNGSGGGAFKAKAGQYVFLNCPDISAFEWHPFTITSAPEEDYVSVHIRIVGDWTTAFARRLGCSFDDEQQFWIEELMSRSTSGQSSGIDRSKAYSTDAKYRSGASAASILQQNTEVMTLPRVLLDGPYGSPSEDAFNYEIAVLVGAGIGVTPFASVLKHIWYSVMQPTKIITLRKVYFFWVCRDRDAFEWFQDLLIALEEQNLSDFLEIRSYLTGELCSEELNTILMEARASAAAAASKHLRRKMKEQQQAQQGTGEHGADLFQPPIPSINLSGSDDSLTGEALTRDAITGLRSPTYYGRPNFDKIFEELSIAHPREQGQVGVFFCGPKPLGKTLHRCARKYKFKFHKGNEKRCNVP
ncbi:hypothetical protein BGZ83_012172 [Gryganskiella cystojenkinii]|nr:hypothetical protein BGZ83_012172 [Gryganskiella cystojenkinii]